MAVGDVTPIPVFPLTSITNGEESGFVLSSTTKAFPDPVCVILTKSDDEFPLNHVVPVIPLTVKLPVIIVFPLTLNPKFVTPVNELF